VSLTQNVGVIVLEACAPGGDFVYLKHEVLGDILVRNSSLLKLNGINTHREPVNTSMAILAVKHEDFGDQLRVAYGYNASNQCHCLKITGK
jgi:hypothetical protein